MEALNVPSLAGKVALVTGASRGTGKGIALALGTAGATVYVTGRSIRGGQRTEGLPGTVESTAEEVTSRGGTGIAVKCDHTVLGDVERLFEQIKNKSNKLDILVNNVWGGFEQYDPAEFTAPFWELPFRHWHGMFTVGLRAQLLASHFAVPLMLRQRSGLIVSLTAWEDFQYLGNLYYDTAKMALNRMSFGMGLELKEHNVASIALAPGFVRTERVLSMFQVTEKDYQTVEDLKDSESVLFAGLAVAHLAADPAVIDRTSGIFRVAQIAEEYGFTDVGSRPRVAAA
jgi:NAD(P)-dependent dehydrogenase (short-subunit alcohol dehydrogenase family)